MNETVKFNQITQILFLHVWKEKSFDGWKIFRTNSGSSLFDRFKTDFFPSMHSLIQLYTLYIHKCMMVIIAFQKIKIELLFNWKRGGKNRGGKERLEKGGRERENRGEKREKKGIEGKSCWRTKLDCFVTDTTHSWLTKSGYWWLLNFVEREREKE